MYVYSFFLENDWIREQMHVSFMRQRAKVVVNVCSTENSHKSGGVSKRYNVAVCTSCKPHKRRKPMGRASIVGGVVACGDKSETNLKLVCVVMPLLKAISLHHNSRSSVTLTRRPSIESRSSPFQYWCLSRLTFSIPCWQPLYDCSCSFI